jgi:glycosyltransferase 2 family protein
MQLIPNIILKNQKILKIIVSLLILIFLLKFVNFQLLFESIKNVNYLIFLVLAIIPINILLRAWRWMIIINKDKKYISLKKSINLNLVGIALNLFLPANSGDIAKSYYGYKWYGFKEEMLSSSILDKFMALFSVFVIGSITAIFMKFYLLSIFSAIFSLIFIILFFYPKIMPWNVLNRILSIFLKIKLNEDKLAHSFSISNEIKLKTFIISIIAWVILYFQFFLLCLSFSVQINFTYILAVSPLMNLALLFPFTLSGLGSGEAMIMYLFSLINISPTLALLVSLMSQVVSVIIPGLIGFLIIMKK